MTTFSTGGSAVTFTTSGSAVSFAVTDATNAFTTSAVLTPGAHASTHGAGGADPITTLGAVAHSGQQTFAAGSAAGPSIAFTGDTNTGIYSPGADQVGIATAGIASVVVESNQDLSHYGGTFKQYSATTFLPQHVLVNASTGSDAAYIIIRKKPGDNTLAASDGIGNLLFQGVDTGGTDRTVAGIVVAAEGANFAAAGPSTNMQFQTANSSGALTERLRIDSAGQLTTGLGSAGTPVLSFSGDTNTGIYSPGADQVGIATAGTARVIVDGSGRVGIGTTPTEYPLEVQTNANTQAVRIVGRSGDDISVIEFLNNARSSTLATISAYGTYVSHQVATTERMRIDNAGLITGTGTSLGAWTSYTPTLGGTGWAIGDGTAAGYYVQIGKIVIFRADVTFGSSSTYGSTSPTLTLPVTARNLYVPNSLVWAQFNDSSAGTRYATTAVINTTTTAIFSGMGTNGAQTTTNSTTPFTWASGDAIRFSAIYEAA